MRFSGGLVLVVLFYAVCLHYSQVDLSALWKGLPRLWTWTSRAWPLDFSEYPVLLQRAAETVAMATIGTTLGALIAVPLCLMAARNTSAGGWVYYPARFLLNLLRGIDVFVFAIIFVAAVGLGPFAGVLGVGLHTAGSIAKLWSEAIETAAPGPIEAATMSGASRLKIVSFALVPDVLPSLASTILYMWEFNVRASTVLGIVGAGGIGQELKNSVDLLMFDRVFAIILIILAMVTVIDQISAFARRRLA
ncbi:phosphonate ABC transporter, permease protein PhnE [Fulvimarina endophytica]|uniref:Phosphonate ABC transporter, permease protein PhnE n=1 Tax=Fulvimarina endophytica TaxID=2293836 RepID=A0A371X5V8_9HYPH|nr:phosphonate ABC transporter, permease protein PhnE [Fulvimarina endophytica]